jgi:hypothetical protein
MQKLLKNQQRFPEKHEEYRILLLLVIWPSQFIAFLQININVFN